MAEIRFDHVTKAYGDVVAVDDVSLDIPDGEFLVLVGPSGCGKSTLLRMIAGLEEVSSGGIAIGERDVTWLAPKDRDIAMVFQTYALYPHMTRAPEPRLRAQGAQDAQGRRSRGGSTTSPSSSASRSSSSAVLRSSPAASGSAWRWGARSRESRRRSCSTSRSRTSTPSFAWGCAPR